MKAKDLIKILQQYPQDIEVCIFDGRKNSFTADGDPNGIGIEADFSVTLMDEDCDPTFIALNYENDDYTESGDVDEGSSIYSYIEKLFKKKK